jgi:predicted RNA-binding protein with PIN domain
LHLIIDGYNLLHSGRSLINLSAAQLQSQRDHLVREIVKYNQQKSLEITVVFDGWLGGWASETRERKLGIELIFSKRGEKADEVIKRLAREEGAGATVVTSDREVMRYAEKMAIAVIPSDRFKERMEKAAFSLPSKESFKEDEEGRGQKKKGPARRLSKKEKRARAALKKL